MGRPGGGGGGMPGGMSQIMKQANQMQLKMKKTQDELAQRNYEGSAGGGAVKITLNGEYLVQKVEIQKDVLESQDAEMLQDLIMTATNEAVKIAKETSQKEMEKITGGLNIPGLF